MTTSAVSSRTGTAAAPPPRQTGEEGASPITSVFGLGVFLTFLFVTVQVVVFLFTASVVQAAAVDGASHGAGAAQTASAAAATERATAVLGRLADDATVTSEVHSDASGQVLRVGIRVRIPTALGTIGLAVVEREAEARIEQ